MASRLYRNRFRVPSTRLRGWDYRRPGIYAVTICVLGRVCCLGEVVEEQMVRSRFGEMAAEEWLRIPETHPHAILDEWIVMPDHVHGILVFEGEAESIQREGLAAGSLGAVIGQFKQRSKKRIRSRQCPNFAWQERFFDQILTDEDEVERYRVYIRENPRRWRPDS
jgi:putative transposase